MENEEIVRNADISENFTIIGNNIIKDERLSIEARFVLIFMRSFKKGWVFYKKDLQERLNVGRRVLDRCFEELAEVGYLIETEMLEKQGLFTSKGYVVYPYSIKDDPITLYSTDVQNVQRKEEPSITKETADVQNVQRGVLSDVQNVHLINTNINTYNTAPTLNSSSPINKVTDKPDEMKKGGGGGGPAAQIDYKGLDESVKLWLQYKKEKKQTYKGANSINTMVNRLWRFSKGNPEKAMEIVENSIAMNYQGFFEPKENNQSTSVQPVKANSNVKFNIK